MSLQNLEPLFAEWWITSLDFVHINTQSSGLKQLRVFRRVSMYDLDGDRLFVPAAKQDIGPVRGLIRPTELTLGDDFRYAGQ